MPVHKVKVGNLSAWEYGHGKKYTFNPKNPSASLKAKKKAIAQGVAIWYSQKRAGKKNIKLKL